MHTKDLDRDHSSVKKGDVVKVKVHKGNKTASVVRSNCRGVWCVIPGLCVVCVSVYVCTPGEKYEMIARYN